MYVSVYTINPPNGKFVKIPEWQNPAKSLQLPSIYIYPLALEALINKTGLIDPAILMYSLKKLVTYAFSYTHA